MLSLPDLNVTIDTIYTLFPERRDDWLSIDGRRKEDIKCEKWTTRIYFFIQIFEHF